MKKTYWVSATVLVVSNMAGSGIFMLPSQLAKIGGISLIGWGVTLIGVISLALIFAKLSSIAYKGTGLYSYVKMALGEYWGHQVNYIYSIAGVIGNVAGLSIISGYSGNLFPAFNSPLFSILEQIILVWLIFVLNIKGFKIINLLQSISLILSLAPIIYLITFGWHLFHFTTFQAGWNTSNLPITHAIASSFHIIMYSFIGIESACVSNTLIKNSKYCVPIATIAGVIITAILYILACTVIMGIIPYQQLITSSAPVALALKSSVDKNAIRIVDTCIILSCFSSLCGWTMITAQMIKNAAQDKIIPNFLAKTNNHNIPINGLLTITTLTILCVFITSKPTANQQFTTVLDVTVLLYLIAYFYSSISFFIIAINKISFNAYIYYGTLSFIAAMFCLISFLDTQLTIIVYTIILTFSSTFFYWFYKKFYKKITLY